MIYIRFERALENETEIEMVKELGPFKSLEYEQQTLFDGGCSDDTDSIIAIEREGIWYTDFEVTTLLNGWKQTRPLMGIDYPYYTSYTIWSD